MKLAALLFRSVDGRASPPLCTLPKIICNDSQRFVDVADPFRPWPHDAPAFARVWVLAPLGGVCEFDAAGVEGGANSRLGEQIREGHLGAGEEAIRGFDARSLCKIDVVLDEVTTCR